jgi:hypothetical protein
MYGISIYYTSDNIIFSIIKTYTNSDIRLILPNVNNYTQLIIIYQNKSNRLYIDYFYGNNVITKLLTPKITNVE